MTDKVMDWSDGTPVLRDKTQAEVDEAPTLADQIATALARVDASAMGAFNTIVPPAMLQLYRMKADAVVAYQQTLGASVAPILANEAAAKGLTTDEVVQSIIDAIQADSDNFDAVNTAWMSARADLPSAADDGEIATILATFDAAVAAWLA